jgi:hypothetical protein
VDVEASSRKKQMSVENVMCINKCFAKKNYTYVGRDGCGGMSNKLVYRDLNHSFVCWGSLSKALLYGGWG